MSKATILKIDRKMQYDVVNVRYQVVGDTPIPEEQKKLDVQRPDGPDGEAVLDMGMFLLAYANAVRVYIEKGESNESV